MLDPPACRRDDMYGIVVLAPAAAPNHQKEVGWRDARQHPCHVGVQAGRMRNAAVPRHEGGYRQAKCLDSGWLGASEDYRDHGASSDDQLGYAQRRSQGDLRDA
jgi:hypothetical protein